MPLENNEYKFPDEQNENQAEIEIEIEDDTPEEDRGKTPSDPKFVEELDKDELDEYSAAAKQKIAAFKKVYHDERRAKEAADRERDGDGLLTDVEPIPTMLALEGRHQRAVARVDAVGFFVPYPESIAERRVVAMEVDIDVAAFDAP